MDKGRESRGRGMNWRIRGEARERTRGIGRGWLLGLLAGAALFGIGAARGELTVIWQKAVMICMECIGIG